MLVLVMLVATPGLLQAQPSFVAASQQAPAQAVDTLTIASPAGVAAGDVLVAQLAIRGGSDVAIESVPAGWSLVLRTNDGTRLAQAIYARVAGSSEPGSHSWQFDAKRRAAGAIVAYRGVDNAAPIEASAAQANAASSAVTAPSITTATAGVELLGLFAVSYGNDAFSAPAGMTERIDVGTGAGPNGATLAVAGEALAATGATGTRTATYGSSRASIGALLALRPGGGTGVTAPGRFDAFDSATPGGATSGVITTRIAAQPFELAVVALDTTGSALEPSFAGTVQVQLLDASDDSGALDAASGCRASWSTVRTLASPSFTTGDAGRITVAGLLEPGAWRIARVRVSWTPPSGPDVVGCSGDAFAVRPASFSVPIASDADWRTTGTARTLDNTAAAGGVVHAAGRPFRVSFAALDATGAPLSSYAGTPALVFAGCALPAACAGASAASLSAPLAAAAGIASTDSASFDEAGAFLAYAEDLSFAAVDVADGSSQVQRRIASPTASIGRFVPDRYLLTVEDVPQFRPGQDTACTGAPSSNFTWMGQPFGWRVPPTVAVVAQNAAGGTMQQVSGPLFKLDASAVMLAWTTNAPAAAALAVSGQTVSVAATGPGNGRIALDAGGQFSFARASTPVAPFQALVTLTVDVSDASEAAVAGNGNIGSVAALVLDGGGSGIEFEGGNASGANLVGYGRIAFSSAHGDSRRGLLLPFETQLWSGDGWYRNQRDNCLQPAPAAVAFIGWNGTLAACDVSVATVTRTVRGQGVVQLSAPVAAATGAVDLALRLDGATGSTCIGGIAQAASSASLPWLLGPWTSAPDHASDPRARATFGRLRVSNVLRRELY